MKICSKNKSNDIFIKILVYILSLVALFFIAGWLSYHVYFVNLINTDRMRLEMYKATLYSTIEQYYYLPYMMSMDQSVRNAVIRSHDNSVIQTLNLHLQKMNSLTKTAALYVLDGNGRTIASSNWNEKKGSYVGHDYSYRPYFIQAMEGLPGRFYGIGSTTYNPGFFLSWAIEHDGRKLGVMVVKISLKDLESAWSEGPDNIMLSDEHSVIFLSSDPSWRMRVLRPLSVKIKKELQATRQYFIQSLAPINHFICFNAQGA